MVLEDSSKRGRSELAESRQSLTELWPLCRRGFILQVSGLTLLRLVQLVGLGGNLLLLVMLSPAPPEATCW